MLKDVVFVQPLPEYRLPVRFEDGVEGIIDVAQTAAFKGVFEPIGNPDFFAQATVKAQLGTVCWPNPS